MTTTHQASFADYVMKQTIVRELRLFAQPAIAQFAYQNMPLFCLLMSKFSALMDFTSSEKKLMEASKEGNFLETQQIRDTLRSSRLGSLVDRLDINATLRAYALFDKGLTPVRFQSLFEQAASSIESQMGCIVSTSFENFAKNVGLTKAQRQLIEIAASMELIPEFAFATAELLQEPTLTKPVREILFSQVKEGELRREISNENWLIQTGLISQSGPRGRLDISEAWLDFFMECENGIPTDYFFEPIRDNESVANEEIARLDSIDKQRIAALLSKSTGGKVTKPTHVLLYGKGHLDRLTLVKDLAKAHDIRLIRPRDMPQPAAMPSIVMACFLYEARQKHKTGEVFVLPKANEVLSRDSSSFIREIFGIEVEDDDRATLTDEKLLASPVTAIWIQGSTQGLHRKVLNAFSLHVEAKGASQAQTRAALEAFIESTGLSENTRIKISRIEGLSQQGLKMALDTASRLHRTGSQAFEAAVLDLLLKSQKAAGYKKPKTIEIPTTYDLNNINARGRFGPDVIAKALAKNRRGTLCLYGLPGTGKTQFARYMGQTLGIPVLEYKASALLDKYVGGSEKNLSQMFETAREQGALLLLDEGDTFLRSRELADRSWEVSLVNELLQQMEEFDGIFVLATNLFRNIDEAALRRFVFKLEFMALSEAQRIRMFEVEAGVNLSQMPEKRAGQFIEDLALMRNLTPGDFAVVKRQAKILDLKLSPEDFIEQLRTEVDYKNKALVKEAGASIPERI